jgi:hypothetical protein
MKNYVYETQALSEQEDKKAAWCAACQAATDLAGMNVVTTNVSSKTDPLLHAHLCHPKPHWYVQVIMRHCSESLHAHVLYRAWFSEGRWNATQVGWSLPKRERYL